jgi:hypothetical protein
VIDLDADTCHSATTVMIVFAAWKKKNWIFHLDAKYRLKTAKRRVESHGDMVLGWLSDSLSVHDKMGTSERL